MKDYLVIGLGKFGVTIAKTLYDAGNSVVAVDTSIEKVQKILNEGTVEDAICLDATDENGLANIAKDSFDAAFVCIGTNVQNSILVTLMLKELQIPKIICKATTRIQGKVLSKVGATQIVYPEEFMGEKIAYSVMNPTVVDYFNFSDDYCIFDIKVPRKFIGRTLRDIDIRNKYHANVIAIKDANGLLDASPAPSYVFNEDDTMIILGKKEIMGDMED